jgi:hypothetical protein
MMFWWMLSRILWDGWDSEMSRAAGFYEGQWMNRNTKFNVRKWNILRLDKSYRLVTTIAAGFLFLSSQCDSRKFSITMNISVGTVTKVFSGRNIQERNKQDSEHGQVLSRRSLVWHFSFSIAMELRKIPVISRINFFVLRVPFVSIPII